jgi:hypothetical protein
MTYDEIINNISHSGSTQLLVKLFGGEIYKIFHLSVNYSGPQETLLSIFGSLMTSLAFFILIFVAIYFFLVGVTNQAQSGEFLRKDWHGAWPILRLGMGISAVIPFPGTNLVLMQAFVISIAMMASSMADITWSKVLSMAANAGISANQTLTPTIDQSKTNAYLKSAFNYGSCVANKIKYSTPDKDLDLNSFNPVNPGNDPEAVAIASSCSSANFQSFLQYASTLSPPKAPDLTPQTGSDLISNTTLEKFNTYQKQQYDYLTDTTILYFIQNRVYPFFVQNMDNIQQGTNLGEVSQQWQALNDSFNKTLQQKVQSAVAADKEMTASVFTSQASLYGWISAGNYYRQLAQQQQIVGNSISSALENTPGYIQLGRQSDLTASETMTDFARSNSNSILNISSAILNHTPHFLRDALSLDLLKSGETTDPILAMTSFGQKLEGTAEALFITHQVATIFSWIPGTGVITNGFVEAIMGITAIAGLILGTVLPCMPWIIFLFAILSWLIYVAEMFVAAPFWIVANAIPDGNTVVNDIAKKGANNILFIALFPTLAIGGLVASLAISWIGMGLLNQFAYAGFKSILGVGTFPLAFIGVLAIYVVLAWSIIVTSLNLIQEFPRQILNWISLSAPGLSPYQDSHANVRDVLLGGRISGAINKATDRSRKKGNQNAILQTV